VSIRSLPKLAVPEHLAHVFRAISCGYRGGRRRGELSGRLPFEGARLLIALVLTQRRAVAPLLRPLLSLRLSLVHPGDSLLFQDSPLPQEIRSGM